MVKPLKLLRDVDANRAAPGAVESRLISVYRRRQAARRRTRWLGLTGALAASIFIGTVVWQLSRVSRSETLPIAVAAIPAPPDFGNFRTKPVITTAAPRYIRRRVTPSRPEPRAPEVTEEFLAIPYAPPFTARDRGEVVRVQIPRQTIRSMGIPVNAERIFERVPADVFMGEDGVPRGIRLIRTSEPR